MNIISQVNSMKKILIILVIFCATSFAQETGARYLIITHDNFYDAIQPIAQWKHKKGLRTKVVKLSQIGSSASQIKTYITNAYNNWQIPPEFLLLVGAPYYLPLPQVSYTYTDNYYTDIEGNIYNEILSGRLTVHDATEAQTVVNKILLYERTPYMDDSLWFINACLIVREDYDSGDTVYWNDINHAKSLMLSAGYDSIDTLCRAAGNNSSDVIQAVNAGRAFVLYRGQAVDYWWSPFNVNPDATANGSKLPIVLSITCRTIGTGSNPATAEKWLLTGTPTLPRGGAGYFATTTIGGGSITFLRSAVCRGFFNAIFEDGKRTFGAACEGGRRNVYNLYGSSSEYRGFTTLGDPEMNIWTDTPCSLICTHPSMIPVGNVGFTVNVLKASNSSPVNNAIVCVVGKLDSTVYALDTTNSSGNASFTVAPHFTGDTIYVTVTGQNLQPYEGSIFTAASDIYIAYLQSTIDDASGGNNDGMVNPGEEINLPLWVKNYGDSTGIDILGTLQEDDVYITIDDAVKSFGDITGGNIDSTGADGYNFTVATNCPDGHIINFELKCEDVNNSVWLSYFNVPVHAPDLIFEQAVISGGNGNSSFEPAETVFVAVTIKNQGSVAIDGVSAILHSLSSYVGVIDSIGTFNHIGPDSSADNNLDPFIVFSDISTPQGTVINFQMIVSSGNYIETITFSLIIGGKHYFIWNPDQSPAPGENMQTILTGLGYQGDYGTTLASDLSLYQSVFVCAGVYPNNRVISNSSPEANTLVDYLENHGGRMYLEGGDVWHYDVQTGGYDFGPLFGIAGVSDGGSDMGPVVGESGAFTQGMSFTYGGENSWMDHINPTGSGFLIFHDGNDAYNCGVANDAGTYQTVGTSFELGLLNDGSPPSTRIALLDSIMHFFGITTGITETAKHLDLSYSHFEVYPNPFSKQINISFQMQDVRSKKQDISLKIYDVSGRIVKVFNLTSGFLPLVSTVSWDGKDDYGNRLPAGVFFVQFTAEDFSKTQKIIFLK
ncbi:T9SS type A sorting domain-containing protein [candidate division WOR-3 bacterium]|nr:T9SS type A sorting domain-containing protein [candidate division WOR-3 bacterium]